MNTNEKKKSKYEKPLEYLAIILVFLVYFLVTDYLPYRPKLNYDPNVVETGKYLSVEEGFYVTDTDEDNMGDRYLLSCQLSKSPEKTKNGYMYSFVDDLRKNGRQFMLISDALLPRDEYLQLDGLVSGYYYVKYKNSTKSGHYFTVLKVTSIKKTGQSLIDFAAPLERTEEPDCSVSQHGIIFSLDKIEYRGPVSRVFFTLEMPADRHLIQYDLCIQSEGKKLSGTFVGTAYTPPYGISSYYSSQDEVFLPLNCKPGSVYNGIMVIQTPDSGKPIDVIYSYYDYSEEEILENGPLLSADEVRTMELSYQPEKPTGE